MNVVASGAPDSVTSAPDWNPVPVTRSVKSRMREGFGVTEVMEGAVAGGGGATGGAAVIVTIALSVEGGVAVLVACMVTLAGLGTVAGAV